MAQQTGSKPESELIYQGPLIGMREAKQKSPASETSAPKKPAASENSSGSLGREAVGVTVGSK